MELEYAFGIILKKYRLKSKLSQEKLAHLSELDRTYIGMIERGQRMPTIKSLFKLSEPLNIAPNQFIKEVELLITSS